MPSLRLALAQVDPTVGDLQANADLVRTWVTRAARQGADLVAFPEMVLTGYPVEDLALRGSFVEASRAALPRLARSLADDGHGDLVVIVGYLDKAEVDTRPGSLVGRPKGLPQNCAAVLHDGGVVGRYAKHHLPNYGVFDEYRIFVPGDELVVIRLNGVDVAVAICEDLWQEGGPVAETRAAGAGLLVVINGSPYERDKDDVRRELVTRRAAEAGCVLAYVNMVGGQDELVFDGDSIVVAADGDLLARGPQFVETLLNVDLDLPAASAPMDGGPAVVRVDLGGRRGPDAPAARPPVHPPHFEPLPPIADVYYALTTGLRDYVRKNGFRSVVLGLSGGIDSALVAALACDAIGARDVHGVSMPSGYSSQHSRDDAADLAARCGLRYREHPIPDMVQAFVDRLGFSGVAEENLQARVRGVILMGLSNAEGHLTLATSNKSELAVGYSTLYGDSVGGFAPLKDVPKTLVWQLARWRNEEAVRRGETEPIPWASITKPPSAELRPDQSDQDTLPPYDVLDDILDHYVEGDRGRGELLAEGFDAETVDTVTTLVDRAEWKRRQFAPGPKISLKAFGRDRRLPITSHWREPEAHVAAVPERSAGRSPAPVDVDG